MNMFAAWILSILAIVVVGTIVDLLMSNSKMHKFIRSIFATITVLVIITPLPSLIKNGFKPDGDFILGGDIKLDESYLNYINKNKIKKMETATIAAFEKDGLQFVQVAITANFDKNEINIVQVIINLEKLVIDKKYEHINKYELVKELVRKYLLVKEDKIIING